MLSDVGSEGTEDEDGYEREEHYEDGDQRRGYVDEVSLSRPCRPSVTGEPPTRSAAEVDQWEDCK